MNEVNSKLTIKTFFMSAEAYNDVSEVNKKIAQKYIESVKNDETVTSQQTIDYNAKIIGFVLKNIKTDLDKLMIDDIDDVQSAITNWKKKDGTDRAASTKKVYRIGIKKFLYWYSRRYDQPKYQNFAKQIKVRGDTGAPKKKPEELLTMAEVDKMIAVASELRDKAIIALLAESGCRIGELLACKTKNVVFTTTGCNLTFPEGKTGARTVPLVFAAPYIDHYLRQHPLRDNPEAPLWVTKHQGGHRALAYSTVQEIIKNVGRAALIKKRIHPHLFRHTAATALCKVWSEPMMRTYLGWKDNSAMPSVYISLGGKDVECAVLADRYGLIEKKQNDKGLEVGQCPKCWKMVPATATFCYNCGMPLTKDAQKDTNTAVTDFAAFINSDPKLMSKLMTLLQQQQ